MLKTTCSFFGHRNTEETIELKTRLEKVIEDLILNENVDTFLFGSKSRFDDICYDVVTVLKEKHSHVKRIYVRAEYPIITDDYKNFLLKSYEDTIFPEKLVDAGKAVYVERNFEMIRKSDFCVFCYKEENVLKNRKSGTKIALDYAVKQGKRIKYV